MLESPPAVDTYQPRRRGFPREATLRGARRGSAKAAIARREYARLADSRMIFSDHTTLASFIVQLRSRGMSLRAIAGELVRLGIWTRDCSKCWTATQVRRIIQRAIEDAPARLAVLDAEANALRAILASEGPIEGT